MIPPPETKPNEYGRPMLMSYSVIQDAALSTNVKDEMKKCIEYYQKEKDFIRFSERYTTTATYLEKLKSTLSSKFPRDNNEADVWKYIKDLIGCSKSETNESLLSIPNISKSSPLLPGLSPGNLNSNLIFTSDIANALFNSGKFPSATSLLGLPDPMAHSTLAANNMFLSTNLFKMQDLLKPLSSSSPIAGQSKSDAKISTPLKIPTDIKTSSKLDFSSDYAGVKSRTDYSISDLSAAKSQTKTDFSASDLSISSVKVPKQEFSVSDLSISSRQMNPNCSLDLSKKSEVGERPPKMPKSDYSSMDYAISSAKSFVQSFANIPSDLSVTTASDHENMAESSSLEQDIPLNLMSQ